MMGATTIWERWDSMRPDGRINPGEMTSFNHYALGAGAPWMHAVIGGVSPGSAGWKKCLIRPIPGGGLKSCRVSHLSPYGMIKVSWNIDGGEFVLVASIPPNATAEIHLPGSRAVESVGSGNHSYRVAYDAPPWPLTPTYPLFTVLHRMMTTSRENPCSPGPERSNWDK
jgi:alpha-L-rhamnosidase